MATNQNIKNKTLALEIDTVYSNYGTLVGSYIFFSFQNVQGPLLGNLFAVDRIFYGQLRPEDIQYCIAIHENWKLLVLTLLLLTS